MGGSARCHQIDLVEAIDGGRGIVNRRQGAHFRHQQRVLAATRGRLGDQLLHLPRTDRGNALFEQTLEGHRAGPRLRIADVIGSPSRQVISREPQAEEIDDCLDSFQNDR